MAIPVWPDILPQKASRDGFSEGSRDGRLRTQMEGGPPKMRRRFSSDPKPITASIRVTVEQWNAFDLFWEQGTSFGSLPFWFPDQSRGDVILETESGAPLLTSEGNLMVNADWWLCLFGDARPAANNLGAAQYSLSFNLAVL